MIFVDHLKSPASGFQEIHYKYNTFLIMMKECLVYVFVSLFVSVFGRIMQQRRRSMNWRLELTRLSGKIGLGSSHSVAPGSAHPNHPNHREILLTSIISLVETPTIGKSFGRCQQIKLLLQSTLALPLSRSAQTKQRASSHIYLKFTSDLGHSFHQMYFENLDQQFKEFQNMLKFLSGGDCPSDNSNHSQSLFWGDILN